MSNQPSETAFHLTGDTLAEKRAVRLPSNIQHLTASNSDEWYTPACYIEAARRVLGQIDLDPASSEVANGIVKAVKFYDRSQNGLLYDWPGRVFLNPPYRRDNIQADFINKLVVQYRRGITTAAILLMGNRTETDWFQPLWDYPICFTDHRIKFYSVSGVADSPVTGNVFVYLGPSLEKFKEVFREYGRVVRCIE
jgi:DNA N-6-adenine-methyltransferase Dam